MDIYEFFNFKDIAAYCKKLGRSLTAWEAAYMIWQSNHHTLQQKCRAWEELVNTTPDEAGLHRFLKQYIARLEQFLEAFQTNTPDCVYSSQKLYAQNPDCYLDESPLYTDYALCVAATMAEIKDKKEILSIRISKRQIHSQPAERLGDAMVYLNPDGQPMGLTVAPYRGERDLLVPPFGFFGMYVALPTPFQKGDIVTAVDLWGQRTGPMIVEKLPQKPGEDYLDMCACLWERDRKGQQRRNEDCSYLSLEYDHRAADAEGGRI